MLREKEAGGASRLLVVHHISKEEVRDALRKMKSGKAVDLDFILMEI